MPVYSFNVISNADIGLDDYNWSGGTYTLSGSPRVMTLTDNDGVLDDESDQVPEDMPEGYQSTYETLDTSSQLMVGDIDGLGADGHIVQSVYRFAVTNQTTGQTGYAYMIRVYNGTDPSTFADDWGNGQLGPYYYAFDIPVSPGDTFELVNDGHWMGQAQYSDLDGYGVTCFAAGTRIATPRGERPVERLMPGDLVLTADDGPQPLRWIGLRRLSAADVAANPALCPVRIAAGALGPGLPVRDLIVSQQHRMLVASPIGTRIGGGAAEVLVAARHLAGLPGIAVMTDPAPVTYVHFLCDAHQIVRAEGAATESLLPGPQALRSLHRAARQEIAAIFPGVAIPGWRLPAARPVLGGRQGRRLAERHIRNPRHPLQAATGS